MDEVSIFMLFLPSLQLEELVYNKQLSNKVKAKLKTNFKSIDEDQSGMLNQKIFF